MPIPANSSTTQGIGKRSEKQNVCFVTFLLTDNEWMPENNQRDNMLSDRLQPTSDHKQNWFRAMRSIDEGLKMPQPLGHLRALGAVTKTWTPCEANRFRS